MAKPIDFDDYISRFPEDVQARLQAIREAIGRVVPEAEEVISYAMPSYKFKGRLVYFAAHTNHIGLYPFGATIEVFKDELAGYKQTKGTVQFQHNEAIPLELIGRMVKYKAADNLKKAGKNKL